MAKRTILLVVVLLGMAGIAFAEAAPAPPGEVHGFLDVTYVSRYMWRGFDVYGQGHGAIQPSIDLDWFGSGLGTNVWMSRAFGSGFENSEQWNYSLYYGGKVCETEPLATVYRFSWVYYNFPDNSSKVKDLQELNGMLSWPNLLGIKGLVPSYVLIKMWPSRSDSVVGGNASGWAHIIMLDYGMAIPGFMPETPQQILNLHSEIIYNDGMGGASGANVDHDWSNAVFGVTTGFDLSKELVLTPGVFYQISMDSSVNKHDEIWGMLSMKYKF